MAPASRRPGRASRVPEVTASQATAFRARRQHLVERQEPGELARVLADMNGAQAQLLRAAQLALWGRLRDLTMERLEEALWQRRTLVRAWCMRRTLYLLPSKDGAIYGRGSARRAEKEIRWMLAHGARTASLEAALAVLLDLLDRPRSRIETAELLAQRLHVPIEFRPGGSGWGSRSKTPWIGFGGIRVPITYALHLAGARGVICLGPPRGNGATYVRGDAWTRSWRDLAPEEAELRLLRRYLRSFGPATPRDFATWTGMTLRDSLGIWGRASSDVVRVDLGGREAWILGADLSELISSSFDRLSVRLLPHFDSFLLGHDDHTNVIARAHRPRVYRGQGWVSPVLLINGTVAGVWNLTGKGNVLAVRVDPFVPLSREARFLVKEEAVSLSRFLGYERAETRIAHT